VVAASRTRATVQRERAYRDDRELVWAVQDAGYGAWLLPAASLRPATARLDLVVQEVSDRARAREAHDVLALARGTCDVLISRAANRVSVVYERGATTPGHLLDVLADTGFHARRLP
jgi:hypothetical protein